MVTRTDTHVLPPRRNTLLVFGLLLAVSAAFFTWVRDNPFWHPEDFVYLKQAIAMHGSWRELFAVGPGQPFQPLVKAIFFLEYSLFGLDAWKYYLLNVIVHATNGLLVYVLVDVLLRDRAIAAMSSLLFVCAVGNYGKTVMVVSGISDLLITLLTLLTLLCYFRNELEKEGKLGSPWFFAAALFFLLSVVTKTSSFSILGCIMAFALFFRSETGKRVLNREFIVIAAIAVVVLLAKLAFFPALATEQGYALGVSNFLRNYASYLVRMVFPMHASMLIAHAGPVVQFMYEIATGIRFAVFLCIVSFTLFGFIFGNRALRFFIVWTYITVTPFCFFRFPLDWLDIRHLYLVSVGFCMILASVTVLAARLLAHRRWRRLLPYSLPLLFVCLSQFIVYQLDTKYERVAEIPAIMEMKEEVLRQHR
jgi:hypothetical protein